jgi:segregation and condensation protein B
MPNEHANMTESPEADTGVTPVENAAEIAVDTQPSPDESAPQLSTDMSASAIDIVEAKRALEAALLAASEPMAINELKRLFDNELSVDTIRNLLEELRAEWATRTIELAVVASGYRFRVKPEYQKYLDRLSNDKPPKYSRAVLETLAIIAYRQPVTRGDIEDIRGVAVSPHILKTLEDRGWIDEVGHKEAPGRPALFATTKHFLDDLNLRSLDELPPLHELQATLDMSAAGAALSAGVETPSLPGVASAAEVESEDADAPVDALAPHAGSLDPISTEAEAPTETIGEEPAADGVARDDGEPTSEVPHPNDTDGAHS